MEIIEFAPAKINLALHVLGRRADGFHEIDSVVAFADIGDELSFEPASEFAIEVSGPFVSLLPAPENNIIRGAWRAVSEIATARGKKLPPVSLTLTKNIPVAAGIGGGSADAAAATRGFLRLAGIDIDDEIRKSALSLGADVPVCLLGKACRLQGVGERVTRIEDFQPLHAVLVNPLIASLTSAVFGKLGLAVGAKHAAPLTSLTDAATWRNDLTPPAMALAPIIADVLVALENHPELCFARMSGSGATCFGVFENADAARRAERHLSAAFPQWWVRRTVLG